MKKILLSLLLAGSLFACGDKNEPDNGSKIKSPDQLEKIIRVRGVKSLSLRAAKNTILGLDSISFITRYAMHHTIKTVRGFTESGFNAFNVWTEGRDTINNTLMFLGLDVLYDFDGDGELELGKYITEYTDIALVGYKRKSDGSYVHPREWTNKGIVFDTIGYIPNKIRNDAAQKITEAFNKKDYDKCQQLFREAFVFLPIDGKRLKYLRDNNLD